MGKKDSNMPQRDCMLSLLHLLPMQDDITELLRVVHAVCSPMIPFDFAVLILVSSLQNGSRMYFYDAGEKSVTEKPLPYACRDLGNCASVEVCGADVLRSHHQIFAECGRSTDQVCYLPLHIPESICLSTLLVFFPNDISLGRIRTFARTVSGAFSIALARILKRNEMQKGATAIRRERDFVAMLLSIATLACTQADPCLVVDRMVGEVRLFFGVRELALYLEHDGTALVTCSLPEGGRGAKEIPRVARVASGDTLLAKMTSAKGVLFSSEQLASCTSDPAVSFFRKERNYAAYAYPLSDREGTLGALVFFGENIEDNCDAAMEQMAGTLVPILRSVSFAQPQEGDEEIKRAEYSEFLGKSPALLRILTQVDLVAPSDATVLLLGETGTGKELVARAVHKQSFRKDKDFVTLNCAAVPRDLLESELFGHEKGAFTGAVKQHKGRFERAQGGTLFLNEVGEMPLDLQPKLLRILQTREMERVGGQESIALDVRLVAATNRNLKQMVADGQFRDDLYYRLNVFPILIPPLRERREDIPLLVTEYAQRFAKRMGKTLSIPTPVMDWFCAQNWPGNIRELVNVVERAVIMSRGSALVVPEAGELQADLKSVDVDANDKERAEIIAAVRASNGVIAGPRGAAVRLGLKRTTLLSRMKRLNLTVKAILENA
ncbi:MAG: sigma 54-interacting transcriptional regulator [Desulfovibrionaceae bacterium]|nr:sigma 54-interacting transcriptional regulator [Desulfovibrionaceae bacterium]